MNAMNTINTVDEAREIRARLGDLLREASRLEGLGDGTKDWATSITHLVRACGSTARAIEAAPLELHRAARR